MKWITQLAVAGLMASAGSCATHYAAEWKPKPHVEFDGVEIATGQKVEEKLLDAARKAVPRNVTSNAVVRALQAGLWNSNRTAVAVSIPRAKGSFVFVFLKNADGHYLAVDVSGVEGPNLGHLGIAGREAYDRIETTPIRWLPRDDELFQIEIRTRAWKSGKRYTTSEPLVIRPDGTPLWR